MVRDGGIGGMNVFKRLSQRSHSTYESSLFGVAELSSRPPVIHVSKLDPIWSAWDEIERMNLGSCWVTALTVRRAGSSGNPYRNRPKGRFLDLNKLYSDLGRWRPAEAEHKGHFAMERGTPSVHTHYTAERERKNQNIWMESG